MTVAVARDQATTHVALLTPSGGDAPLAASVLARSGIATEACADMAEMCGWIREGVGALLITEEALGRTERRQLLEALSQQPAWSDVPVVLLVSPGELSGALSPGVRAVAQRGNVTLLERPVRVATLATTLEAALRARSRQYEMRDAVARRAASEQEVRDSEARLRAAVEASPYPLMVHADDGEVIHLSRTWTELTGYSAEQLRSIDAWIDLAHGAEGDDVRAQMRADLHASRTLGISVPLWERDVRIADGGMRRWAFNTTQLGHMADGRQLRLVAGADVTEMRRLLQNERRLRELAEEANKTKMQFLATMSHELRTPLNAIGGHVQLMEMEILGRVTARQREALARVRRAEGHLLGLINDVLNFAKIEAGRVTFDLKEVTLGTLLDAVDELIAPQLRTKGISYTRPKDLDGTVVVADIEKARQVMLNLLSNAMKFTGRHGEITVTCSVDDGVAAIRIRDTGIGIADELLESMFEPFVQVRADYSANNQGTGLGLAISRDLARAMHGDLTAESQLGKGSTFSFTLPVAVRKEAASPTAGMGLGA
jgi:PAS domain S-box-containing protein